MNIYKILGIVFILFLSGITKNEAFEQSMPSGTAVILTGAASNISQQTALLESLYNSGKLNDLVFISGISSGSLNAVMLNGIMEHKISWEEYKSLIFSIRDSSVFLQLKKGLPVNTAPLRKLFFNIAYKRLHYKKIGDLPIPTAISVTQVKDLGMTKISYRLCSERINTESDTSINLVNILMASTAFPLIFPAIKIPDAATLPDAKFYDGGFGEDLVPYKALLEFEAYRGRPVKNVYIISKKALSQTTEGELSNLDIRNKNTFVKIGKTMVMYNEYNIFDALNEIKINYPELASKTKVWLPDFNQDFPLFNFNFMKEQYEVCSEWAKANPPIPLVQMMLASGKKTNTSK